MLDNYIDELSKATRTNGSKNCPNCGAPIETETCPSTFIRPISSLTLDFDILD